MAFGGLRVAQLLDSCQEKEESNLPAQSLKFKQLTV